MATYISLDIDQGSDFTKEYSLTQVDGTPLSLTGKTLEAHIRKNYTSTMAYAFTTNILEAETGKISIYLPALNSLLMKPGRYVFDAIVTTAASGAKARVLEGNVDITPSITRVDQGQIQFASYPYCASGHGTPETFVTGLPGYSYVDVDSNTLYFKMTGNSTTGWQAFVQL